MRISHVGRSRISIVRESALNAQSYLRVLSITRAIIAFVVFCELFREIADHPLPAEQSIAASVTVAYSNCNVPFGRASNFLQVIAGADADR